MIIGEPSDVADFRQRVRDWLESNCERVQSRLPIHVFEAANASRLPQARSLQRRLADEGLAGLTWPKEFGGQGADLVHQIVFDQEAMAFDTPMSIFGIGLAMAGPTIIAHGSDDQRSQYLSPILRGEEVWCQLFSEPDAGSDLAAVRTRAVEDGDEWVVDGQKVWSSGAHYADRGILLARTDPSQPRHRGLTFFVVDMRAPGVTVRPLRQMTGDAHFNEVFLEGVRLPMSSVIGEKNGGWAVARTTLVSERMLIGGGFSLDPSALVSLAQCSSVGGHPAASDPTVRQELADMYCKAKIAQWLHGKLLSALMEGRMPGPEGSVTKLLVAGLLRQASSLATRLQGATAMINSDDEPVSEWQKLLLLAPAFRILGGTDEIQRNILAEQVLGLPRDHDPSRSEPFNQSQRIEPHVTAG